MGEIKNKSTINVQKWDQNQELFKYLFFFLKILIPLFLYSFDGVDTLAEHEEFLPQKSSLKKESRFTDVSAEVKWERNSNIIDRICSFGL